MKMLVTESQLRNLVKRQRDKRKKEKEVEESASLTSPSTTNTSASSTPTTPTMPTDTEDTYGKSMSAAEYPAYPEVTTWDGVVGSKLVRGKANTSFDNKSHWKSGVTRGPANQVAPSSQ